MTDTKTGLSPTILDIAHWDTVHSFAQVSEAGIKGVILKASQGTRGIDPTFHQRVVDAKAASLLVGAYHFGTSAPVDDQVAHFLEVVGDWAHEADFLLALDYEENSQSKSDSMSLEQAISFLKLVREKTGQRPVLYSGKDLKEALPSGGNAFISTHRLWLSHYAVRPKLPAGFTAYWAWQFTGDGQGPAPHYIGGIEAQGGVDLSVFGGEDLAKEWVDRPEESVAEAAPKGRSDSEPAEAAPDPTPIREKPTSGEMRATSRKWRLYDLLQFKLFGGVLGLGGYSALDSVNSTKALADAVKAFFTDYGIPLTLLLLFIAFGVIVLIKEHAKEDVAEGRSTPSGAANS